MFVIIDRENKPFSNQLDQVAEGGEDWVQLLRNFTQDFYPLLDKARETMTQLKAGMDTGLSYPQCEDGRLSISEMNMKTTYIIRNVRQSRVNLCLHILFTIIVKAVRCAHDFPSFFVFLACNNERINVIGMIDNVLVNFTVTALSKVWVPRPHMLSHVAAAAVTEEVSLIAVPENMPNASSKIGRASCRERV